MSCYICNPQHIGALAAYAARPQHSVISECRSPTSNPVDTARLVAALLMEANIYSFDYRYKHKALYQDVAEEALDSIREAEAFAVKYTYKPPKLTPLDIIKMVQCLDYQSCEPHDWTGSIAQRQLDWIMVDAIRELPGYDTAIRDFEG